MSQTGRHQNNDDRRSQRIQFLRKSLQDIASARQELIIQLEDLDAQARALQLEHNSLQNLNAPTSNVPEEVLAMVFEAGTAGCASDFGRLVSHVSHRWRSIALANPYLWTDIRYARRLDFRLSLDDSTFRFSVERAITYLYRSRTVPVDIYIEIIDKKEIYPVLQSMADHMRHCRSLRVSSRSDDSCRKVLAFASRHPAPLLVSLTVTSNALIKEPLSKPLFSLGAPNLRTVALSGFYTSTDQDVSLCMPIMQSVTQLRLSNIEIVGTESYSSFRNVLMALHALSHLELHGEVFRIAWTSIQQIELPGLRSLELDFDQLDLANLIGSIHAPALDSLLLGRWTEDESVFRGWSRLPEECLSLRHLIIVNPLAASQDFSSLAKIYPNVEHLTFNAKYDDEDLTEILMAILDTRGDETIVSDEQMLWPKLKKIAVGALETEFTILPLCDTILQLQKAGRPLDTLSLPERLLSRWDAKELRDIVHVEDYRHEYPTPFGIMW